MSFYNPHRSFSATHPIEILLVEDNPADIRLTSEALRGGQIPTHLNVARDGVEAIDFLRRRAAYATAPRPDIVLLDLNLPRKNGREVLAEIKQDPDLKTIPVIVLSTSQDEEDIWRSYHLQANAYITKPVDLDQFMAAMRGFQNFWVTIVKLPPNKARIHGG